MSEPYKPWAWPTAYRKAFVHAPVALRAFGDHLAVLTSGYPSRLYGTHPAAMGREDYPNDVYPCTAADGVAGKAGMVFWPSAAGLCAMSADGVANWSDAQDVYDAASWAAAAPARAVFHDEMYFGFNAAGGIAIDPRTATVVALSVIAHACCLGSDGCLYLVLDDALDPDTGQMLLGVFKWAADPINYMYHTFRSRVALQAYASCPAYALVVRDRSFYDQVAAALDLATVNAAAFAGDIGGALRVSALRTLALRGCSLVGAGDYAMSAHANVRVYFADRLQAQTDVATDRFMGALPTGYEVSDRIAVEISGYVPVTRLAVATAPEELMGVQG